MKKPTLREALNSDKASGPPPRQQAAPPRPADLHLHLPGPPSRHTTTRKRATTPHNSVTRSPSCTEQTARRPWPSRQHPGPPPRPKSPQRRVNRANNLIALATQDCHPSHVSNPLRETADHHGSRGHCPGIHRRQPPTTTSFHRSLQLVPTPKARPQGVSDARRHPRPTHAGSEVSPRVLPSGGAYNRLNNAFKKVAMPTYASVVCPGHKPGARP
jgi:hypothetical protein